MCHVISSVLSHDPSIPGITFYVLNCQQNYCFSSFSSQTAVSLVVLWARRFIYTSIILYLPDTTGQSSCHVSGLAQAHGHCFLVHLTSLSKSEQCEAWSPVVASSLCAVCTEICCFLESGNIEFVLQ